MWPRRYLHSGVGDSRNGNIMKEDSGSQRTRVSETILITNYIESEVDASQWFCPYDPWVVKRRRVCRRALKRLRDDNMAEECFKLWLGDAIDVTRSRIDHDATWLDRFPEFAWVKGAKDAPPSRQSSVTATVFEILRVPNVRSQYECLCHNCCAKGQ